eukprot:1627099-Pyramimonas_sp.AAC.1
MRQLDKNRTPPLYQAYLPGWDEQRSQKKLFLVNVSLPHELLDFFVDPSDLPDWAQFEPGLQPMVRALSERGNSLDLPIDAVAE